MMQPWMHGPLIRRVAARRAAKARESTVGAMDPSRGMEPSRLLDFGEEEADPVLVGAGERLPGGQSREEQIHEMEQAEGYARTCLNSVMINNKNHFDRALSAFDNRVHTILAEERGESVPGSAFFSVGLSALWQVLRAEIPLLAVELPGIGGVGAVAGMVAGAIADQRPEFNIVDSAGKLKDEALRAWAQASQKQLESFVPRHRKPIHEAWFHAEAERLGSGNSAVEAVLGELGVRPVGEHFAALLAGHLERTLRDAIIAWKCANDTLYGVARAGACASLPAHRE